MEHYAPGPHVACVQTLLGTRNISCAQPSYFTTIRISVHLSVFFLLQHAVILVRLVTAPVKGLTYLLQCCLAYWRQTGGI